MMMLIRACVLLFVALLSTGFCAEDHKAKICLNMIVKDESLVIRRCLESTKPFIDYWVIVDTGSKDGTQQIVKECMKGIPGELFERPWVNFAHNRNEAMQLAKGKGDYLLFIDADDTFVYEPNFVKPSFLDQDGYLMRIRYNGMEYDRIQLISTHVDWKWVGVVHEVLVCDQARATPILPGVVMKIVGGGGRSNDPKKYYKDALLLEAALKEDPSSTRTAFYLAQSYRDAGMLEESIKAYQKRVDMGGWDQEVFWSLYQIACMQESLGAPQDVVTKSYEKAYLFRPQRAETLCQMATYHRKQGNFLLGYLLSKLGLETKKPQDVLFVEAWVYEYGLLLENSICAFYVGRLQEALEESTRLLTMSTLPQNVIDCVKSNLKIIADRMSQEQKPLVAAAGA